MEYFLKICSLGFIGVKTFIGVSGLRQTANANLYHVTKSPLYLFFTVHYFYAYIGSVIKFSIHKNYFELFLSAHFLF